MESSDIEWVTIKTTRPVLPFLPNSQRRAIMTNRLILRPFEDTEDDLKDLHGIRTSFEVMKWTRQGRIDKDLDETRTVALARTLPPNDIQRFDWAICLASTGRIIGVGGNSYLDGSQGWPEVGYMFHPDAWGKGYATEFLEAFLDAWWELPREEVELKVDKKTVRGEGDVKSEVIAATADGINAASHNVLRKGGFELTTLWVEDDVRDLTQKITLHGFIHTKNSKAK
ncbi:GNAT domain-containing protein [Mariannaea sp. PMI_226]|nr:GNAT domain-containing protein [Mariannaea sp. PMI_226]